MNDEWLYILLGCLVGGWIGMALYFTAMSSEYDTYKSIKTSEPIKIEKKIYRCEEVRL